MGCYTYCFDDTNNTLPSLIFEMFQTEMAKRGRTRKMELHPGNYPNHWQFTENTWPKVDS